MASSRAASGGTSADRGVYLELARSDLNVLDRAPPERAGEAA